MSKYKLREISPEGITVTVFEYDDGSEQVVTPDHQLYHDWVSAGNVPERIPYEAPPPYVDPVIPPERQQFYSEIFALLQEMGITTPPLDDKEAEEKIDYWANGRVGSIRQLNDSIRIILKLMNKLRRVKEAGGSWAEALRYARESAT